MIVGLTGGIGSGKTTVLDLFKTIGNIATYNADVEAKKLMNSSETIRKKLINIFGKASFQDGVLNRKYLSKVVFSDKENFPSLPSSSSILSSISKSLPCQTLYSELNFL